MLLILFPFSYRLQSYEKVWNALHFASEFFEILLPLQKFFVPLPLQ